MVAREEKYLVKRLAQQLIKRAAGDAFPEFNNQAFTNDSSLDSVGDAAQALPFFAQRKCVSVADFDVEAKSPQELEKLYELWELAPESTTLVFWYPTLDFDGKRSSKWRKFLKQAEERGTVALCARRGQGDLLRFVAREAEKAGCALPAAGGPKAAGIRRPGFDHPAKRGGKAVRLRPGPGAGGNHPGHDRGAGGQVHGNHGVFALGALVAGNYEKAYTLLDALFYQREEPIAILGALATSYVDMVRVRAALENGGTYGDAAQYGDYKGKDFRLKKAQQNVRGVPQQVLRESLHLLLEADMALKGSRLEPRIILDELIAKLLLAARRERA